MHFHLTQQHRIELSLLLRLGHTQRSCALVLGVSPSTICRELARNRQPSGKYHAIYARLRTAARRLSANQRLRKLVGNVSLEEVVTSKLRLHWSPEQIAGWLRVHKHPARVCAQTIYDWLYTSRKDLLVWLRSQKRRYRRTRANTLRKRQREQMLANRRIDHRPVSVAGRKFYGHWEGDTMVSKQNTARLGTLVERKSGYLRAFRLANGSSHGFAVAASAALQAVPNRYRKTLTLDNGTEMQDYELLERRAGLDVYFAYPYHSWERGTNENTNGYSGSTSRSGAAWLSARRNWTGLSSC
ncbi:IS30 family transposase [Candidatus Saccharibacteria bacterium]|nr:MAG: IS30 family transposase [Candidatus Saccharibacteria bacterium]